MNIDHEKCRQFIVEIEQIGEELKGSTSIYLLTGVDEKMSRLFQRGNKEQREFFQALEPCRVNCYSHLVKGQSMDEKVGKAHDIMREAFDDLITQARARLAALSDPSLGGRVPTSGQKQNGRVADSRLGAGRDSTMLKPHTELTTAEVRRIRELEDQLRAEGSEHNRTRCTLEAEQKQSKGFADECREMAERLNRKEAEYQSSLASARREFLEQLHHAEQEHNTRIVALRQEYSAEQDRLQAEAAETQERLRTEVAETASLLEAATAETARLLEEAADTQERLLAEVAETVSLLEGAQSQTRRAEQQLVDRQVETARLQEQIQDLERRPSVPHDLCELEQGLVERLETLPVPLGSFAQSLLDIVQDLQSDCTQIPDKLLCEEGLANLDDFIYRPAPAYGLLASPDFTHDQTETLCTALLYVTALQTWTHQQLVERQLSLINPQIGAAFDASRHTAAEADWVWVNTDATLHNQVAGVKLVGYERSGTVLRKAQIKRYIFTGAYNANELSTVPPSALTL